ELGGHDVPSAAGGEVLDDARVRVADDEDGQRHPEGEAHGERGVLLAGLDQLAKRLIRSVRARREAVGAEADPGEHRHQRDRVEGLRVANVLGGAEEQAPDARWHDEFQLSTAAARRWKSSPWPPFLCFLYAGYAAPMTEAVHGAPKIAT